MRPTTISTEDHPPPSPPSQSQPACPVCNGPLLELRGFVRCLRCHFSMCSGCDNERGPE